MCSSIREFGFKIPVLARSDGEVVDGHLRLKAAYKLGSWPGGDTTGIPMILCDEWTPAQVKAFRLMANRSVTWADWDESGLCQYGIFGTTKFGLKELMRRSKTVGPLLGHEKVYSLFTRVKPPAK
jgi:hypothetical protein